MKDSKIKAVIDDDLEELLSSLGMLDKVLQGEGRCLYCGRKMTLELIDAIVPVKGEGGQYIGLVCSAGACRAKLLVGGNR